MLAPESPRCANSYIMVATRKHFIMRMGSRGRYWLGRAKICVRHDCQIIHDQILKIFMNKLGHIRRGVSDTCISRWTLKFARHSKRAVESIARANHLGTPWCSWHHFQSAHSCVFCTHSSRHAHFAPRHPDFSQVTTLWQAPTNFTYVYLP